MDLSIQHLGDQPLQEAEELKILDYFFPNRRTQLRTYVTASNCYYDVYEGDPANDAPWKELLINFKYAKGGTA
jgi:hypothetical protein